MSSLEEVPATGYLELFASVLDAGDLSQLLRLWDEYVSFEQISDKELIEVLQMIHKSKLSEYLGRHVERILPLWEPYKNTQNGNSILQLILDIETTDSPELRVLASECLNSLFEENVDHLQKMKLVGLRGDSDPFQGAISHYLLVNHMQKGLFVFHSGGWGVGETLDISLIREEATFEFDYVSGQQHLSLSACFLSLTPIPSSHFLVRRFDDPDTLEAEAKKEPLKIIHKMLKDLGPLTALEIRDELYELVIPEEDWNRWWQVVRTKIKKDPLIENPQTPKGTFSLVTTPVTHLDRCAAILKEGEDTGSLLDKIYSTAKDFPDFLRDEKVVQPLQTLIQEQLSTKNPSLTHHIQLLLLLEEMGESAIDSQIEARLINKEIKDVKEVLRNLPQHSLKKRFLTCLQNTQNNWPEIFGALLYEANTASLKDFIFGELQKMEAENQSLELKSSLNTLVHEPMTSPDTFFWYFQKVQNNPQLPYGTGPGASTLFEHFLILMHLIEEKIQLRPLMKKMHNALSADRYRLIRKVMKEFPLEDIQEFLLLISKCHQFPKHDMKIFHSLAETEHPSLANDRQEKEEILWITQPGYQKLQKTLERLGTVEMVENARDIETARAHGDLRENGEFKAAMERAGQIQEQIRRLSEALQSCRVLTESDLQKDHVGIGSVVTLRSEKGDAEYTILGPWDTSLDEPSFGQNVLSWQSQLAQAMWGLKPGDSFSLQDKLYTILDLDTVSI